MRTSRMKAVALMLLLATSIPAVAQVPAVVELASVTESTSSSVIKLPGTVISIRDAQISAELDGRITWIAEVGEYLEQGQPLVRLDDHLLQLQLENDEAQIARIQADIGYNQRQRQRLQKLAAQNNMAQSELDEIESRLLMLEQDLRIAGVNRDRSRYNLERCAIVAPFSGVVVARDMAVGEYTSTGRTMLRLVDTGALEISVSAPLRVARYNTVGTALEVLAEGNQSSATIRSIVPVGDSRSRMMELRLNASAGDWLIGEAVTVEVPDSPPEMALMVPRDALVLRDQDVFVYTVSTENTAVRVPVITGAGQGDNITIDADLKPGDAVVVRGAERLREGQELKITRNHIALSR